MKYLILSDIHGSLPRLEQVLRFFDENSYDMMAILGDIANYGPRNGLCEGLDAMGVISRLNGYADRVVAVRGNCDAEVDQMLLRFPIMADYSMLVEGGKRVFLTHGHGITPEKRPPLGIDVFMYGHTHLWRLERGEDGVLVCNTGSITFPKEGRPATFATIDEGVLSVRLLDGSVLSSARL